MVLTAIVYRREPLEGPEFVPPRANVRALEAVAPQQAPDPIRQGDFNYEGKPLVHAQSRQQIAVTLSPQSILAVQQDNFGVGKVEFQSPEASMSGRAGGMAPFSERANIRRDPVTAYGSLFELAPVDPYPFPLDVGGMR